MAVSPIGNITHIHQNAQVGSVQHANSQVKLDFQAMVNLQEMQDKQDEIQEVRPAEEVLETNDEREVTKSCEILKKKSRGNTNKVLHRNIQMHNRAIFFCLYRIL